MGSVYRIIKEQRKSGMRYIVDYRDDSGRRTMRRFKKAREAEAFKKQVEASSITGIAIARPVAITFSTWSQEWFDQKEALCKAGKKPRPSTLDSWRSDLKALLSYFGAYKLHTITTDAIIKYIEYLQVTPIESGLRNGGKVPSEKSIRNKVGLLSLMLRSAKARRIIPSNPAQEIDWKEMLGAEEKYHKRHRDMPLTPEALLHLLEVARKHYTPKGGYEPTGPYYPFFEVAVWTGLRLGELIGLRWADVDLDSTPAILSVERSTYRGVDGPTKSMAGVRQVLLINRVVDILQRHRALCLGTSRPKNFRDLPLFQTATGKKLDPDNIRHRHFGALLKRAELPHIRIHDLRDCFATLLASVVHYRILHIVLGHERLDTTLQYYVKAERLTDLLHGNDQDIVAIRQEFKALYKMAHERYAGIGGGALGS